MDTVKMLSILGLLFLSACQTSSGSFCDIAKPQRPSAATFAVMTDAEVSAMLAHNLKGAKLCGWKA